MTSFNEARAERPGKWAATSRPGGAGACFNEARAERPGKCLRSAHCGASYACFNEARAERPGKSRPADVMIALMNALQ